MMLTAMPPMMAREIHLLNLPASIPGKSLIYIYDDAGNKLRKISSGAPTDYVGGI